MIILGIAGEMGTGKDTVKEYLVNHYNAHSFGFSVALRDILERLSLDTCRANYATLAESLRGAFGENILTKVIIEDVSRVSASLVVVEGMRKFGELKDLLNMPNFRLVFVDTDLRTRYERTKNRGTKADDRTKTFEEFVHDHEHAADREVHSLKQYANFVIENNTTLEDLYVAVDAVVTRLHEKKSVNFL